MSKYPYNNRIYRINRGVVIHNANNHCNICNKVTSDFEVHHINGVNTDNRLENLMAVCKDCHILIHKAQSCENMHIL